MAVRKQISKQKEEEEEYLKWQKEYNETGCKDILWTHLYPYLVDTLQSCIASIVRGHQPKYMTYREVAEEGALIILKRYIKDPSYSKNKPKTMCYLEARNLCASSEYFPRAEYTNFNVEDLTDHQVFDTSDR